MIVINTLIGIITIIALTYVSYKIGICVARILEIIDREDEHDNLFIKVFQTLLGAPVIALICLSIKLAYEIGHSITAMFV